MAKWTKGQSGNPKGRPVQFSAVGEIRSFLEKSKRSLVAEAFEALDRIEDPQYKLQGILRLMEFMYSKPKEIEISVEHAVEIVKQAITDRRTGENTPLPAIRHETSV